MTPKKSRKRKPRQNEKQRKKNPKDPTHKSSFVFVCHIAICQILFFYYVACSHSLFNLFGVLFSYRQHSIVLDSCFVCVCSSCFVSFCTRRVMNKGALRLIFRQKYIEKATMYGRVDGTTKRVCTHKNCGVCV